MFTFLMFIAAAGSFIMAFYSGYWALDLIYKSDNQDKPHREFGIRQLTLGAWVFAIIFVAIMFLAAVNYIGDKDEPLIEVVPDNTETIEPEKGKLT